MFGKVLSAACLAAMFGATPVLADLRGPAELPPAGYKGQQYVDSNGCVFLRAGYGGQVTWVPRVSRDRKQLCGYPSSGGQVESVDATPAPAPAPAAAPVVAAAPEPAPAPKAAPKVAEGPKVVAAPAPKAAPVVAAAPVIVERPATPTERAATAPEVVGTPAGTGSTEGFRLACPADTPVAERFEIRGGGTKLMCTTGNGSLDGANFPVLVAGSTDGYPTGFDAWVAAGMDPRAPGAPSGGTVHAHGMAAKDGGVHGSTKSAKYPAMVPPPGYKLAWKDGRLNPNRGKQTVDGFLAMDQIWTRTVPSELREDFKGKQRPVKVIVRRSDGTTYDRQGMYVTGADGIERLYVDTGNGMTAAGCGPDLGTTCSTGGGGETPAVVASTKSDPKVVTKSKAAAPEEPRQVATTKPASGKSKAAPTAGDLRLLVQVGTYGVKSNADGAAGRLQGMGLPVARGKLQGGALTVVYAGPFASAAEAKAALSKARGAGFSDAMIVQ